MTHQAEVIDEGAVPALVEELFDLTRAGPVIAVTTRYREPLVHVPALVAAVGGRGRVVVLEGGAATDALVEALPDRFGVFGGACRIWWPGLTRDADPLDHPLVWVRPENADAAVRRVTAELNAWSPLPSRETAEGEDVEGTVVAIDPTGATVDIGAARPAYAHRRYLTREGVDDPHDVLRVGQSIRARVGRVTANGDVQLDLRDHQGDGWAILTDDAKVGDVVRARVVRVFNGGSRLVEVLPGVTGLVPVHLLRDGDQPGVGDVVAARLVSVDARAKKATLSLRDAPESTDGAVPLRLMIGGPVFLAERDADAEVQASEVDRLRAEVERLEDELASSRDHVAQLEEERLRLRAELRASRDRAREARPKAARDASPVDSPEAFLAAVHDAYERLYLQGDRERYLLGEVRLGDGFLDSVRRLQGVDAGKIIEVVAHVGANRAHEIPGIQAHPWRTGDGGAPQRERPDGARGWRAALQVGTPSARRLHYWVIPTPAGRVIELDEVGVHDEHI